MNIGEIVITVVAIGLAFTLMFVFPLMSISERNDDIALLAAQKATVEFIDNIRSTGKITQDNYDKYIQNLYATGNSYDVEISVKVLDENPGKKGAETNQTKIGENVYYTIYTSQIEEELGIGKDNPKSTTMLLKEGDIVSASGKNTSTSLAQILENFLYNISGKDIYRIEFSHSGVVMTDGK